MHPGPEPPRTAPAFSPWSTALFGIAWLLLLIQGWGALLSGDPGSWLAQPGESAARMSNRDIALAEAAETSAWLQGEQPVLRWKSYPEAPGQAADAMAWLRAQLRVFRSGGFEDTLAYAISIHEEVLEGYAEFDSAEVDVAEASDRVRAALSILFAEAGDPLRALELAEQLSDGGAFAQSVSAAYAAALDTGRGAAGGGRAADDSPRVGDEALPLAVLAEAGLEEWMLARPSIHLLGRSSAGRPIAEALAVHLARRGESLQVRLEVLRGLQLAIVAVGLGVLLCAAWRSRGAGPAAALHGRDSTPRAPPWLLADGIGVLVRGELWGRLYYYLLAHAGAFHLPTSLSGALHGWGGLLSALPLLWLVHRHLLSPRSGRAEREDPLGLAPCPSRGWTLVCITVAALAIDLFVSDALGWLIWGIGIEGHWAEGFDETLAFGSAGQALLEASGYLVWAPLFEELAFRGLLYFSLRRRLAPLPAALLSAGVFGLVHFYSLPGFVPTFWSGCVWALAFERARSLWPCIAAHALYNASFVAWMVLIYR